MRTLGEAEEADNEVAQAEAFVEVQLHDTATDGRGVGRLPEGKVVFVRGAVGGERVRVRLEREGRSLAEGRVESVQRPSGLRQQPPCVQADRCGGCQLQHVTPEGQLVLKREWLLQTLRRVGRWSPLQIERAQTVLRCQQASPTGYRVRTRWHFDGERLGFFAPRSHQVISAEGCLLLAPALEAARGRLLDRLSDPGLRRLYQRAGLVGLQLEATHLQDDAVALRLCGLVCRSREGKRWLVRRLKLLLREWNQGRSGSFLEVSHPTRQPFWIGARGFVQPHQEALSLYREEILGRLRELLPEDVFRGLRGASQWAAWDLYCGAGTLSDLPTLAAGSGRKITTWMVDGEESSIAALSRNHPSLAAHALVEDVHRFIRVRTRDQDWPDIVISDPPRDGMGAASCRILSRALADRGAPTALVWLACDNASLARDLQPFLEAGFQLYSMALFDCFAYTSHAETVTLLWCPFVG